MPYQYVAISTVPICGGSSSSSSSSRPRFNITQHSLHGSSQHTAVRLPLPCRRQRPELRVCKCYAARLQSSYRHGKPNLKTDPNSACTSRLLVRTCRQACCSSSQLTFYPVTLSGCVSSRIPGLACRMTMQAANGVHPLCFTSVLGHPLTDIQERTGEHTSLRFLTLLTLSGFGLQDLEPRNWQVYQQRLAGFAVADERAALRADARRLQDSAASLKREPSPMATKPCVTHQAMEVGSRFAPLLCS